MKISANYATYPAPGRLEALLKSINSILPQVDIVRVYFNSYTLDQIPPLPNKVHPIVIPGLNLTDLGKFYPLSHLKQHEYYFTCDDDIQYPPDYIQHTLRYSNLGAVLTYHGRIINPLGNPKSYYRGGHFVYSYLDPHPVSRELHIPGTGVMMIDTSMADINHVPDHPHCMADLVFANACDSPIHLVPHSGGWLKNIWVDGCITSRFTNRSADESLHLFQIQKLIRKFAL